MRNFGSQVCLKSTQQMSEHATHRMVDHVTDGGNHYYLYKAL
jgi:hypothetical protein